jgi:hypothetical protein
MQHVDLDADPAQALDPTNGRALATCGGGYMFVTTSVCTG